MRSKILTLINPLSLELYTVGSGTKVRLAGFIIIILYRKSTISHFALIVNASEWNWHHGGKLTAVHSRGYRPSRLSAPLCRKYRSDPAYWISQSINQDT